ncbi:MAG TPA: FecR domain-containing protein, partial [Syntrophales bacterium]|nr:FecR domain-containing protein [Syntrophales bacterium]
MRPHATFLIFTLVILAILSSLTPCHAQTQAQAATAQAATAEAAQERWMAVLTSMEGSVFIRRTGNAQWLPARINDRFFPGDMVRVEAESRAALLFTNDSTMRLDQNTTITFQEMEEQTIVMRMLNGAGCFFSRIQRSLKLFTPHVNGTVKGTEFLVRVDADETLISLYNGQ